MYPTAVLVFIFVFTPKKYIEIHRKIDVFLSCTSVWAVVLFEL